MKKFLVVAVLFVALLACTGMAAGEPYSTVYHYSVSDLVENKAIYETAYFRQIEFSFEEDRAETDQDRNTTGAFTIKNGTYYYNDNTGTRVNVSGEDKTFDLTYSSGSSSYVAFRPSVNDSAIYFRGPADGGLQNKIYSWSLYNYATDETVPAFRTFTQQLATYVPYVERTSSGQTFSWRMVSPNNTAKALSVPYHGRYRLRFRDKTGKNLVTGDWNEFDAGRTPSGSYILPSSVSASQVQRIFVDVQLHEKANERYYRYVWSFFVADRSNEGVANPSALTETVELNTAEETTIRISFKTNYHSYISPNPILIADKSIVEQTSWTYDDTLQQGLLVLKALKKGKTTFSLLYENTDGSGYQTVPTEIVVEGGSSKGDSGGGGCNAGFTGLGALALIGHALKRGKK